MFEFCVILTVIQVLYILYYFIGYKRLKGQLKNIFLILCGGLYCLGYIYRESLDAFWHDIKSSALFDYICVIIAIQTIFFLYHIGSWKWIRTYVEKLICFIGICFIAFSVIFIELLREIFQLFYEFSVIKNGREYFFWEGHRGLQMIMNHLSLNMALVFVNMIIVLIVLFYRSRRIKSV